MRVLAVTGDANLLTALTSMMREWEIQAARTATEAKEAGTDADVVLVDSGTTDRGLLTAQELWQGGVTIPCLVIGDVEVPGARTRVLVRPFNLQDLSEAVEAAAKEPGIEPGAGAAPPAEPEIVAEEPEPREGAPEPGVEPVEASAPAEPYQEAVGAEEADDLLAEIAEPETIISEIMEEAASREPEFTGPADAEEPTKAPPSPRGSPYAELEGLQDGRGSGAGPAPEPAQEARTAPSGREAVRPAPRGEGLLRRLRRKAEPKKAVEDPVRDPTVGRLMAAIVAGRELEALVAELPVLTQPRAMAHAFLGEVVDLFQPQVAAVYAQGSDGNYSVIAGHGLSNVEAGMRVPPNQALFMEIASGLEAVLIAPVDLAQGLVAGIGGARTEALIAAPLEVTGTCHAIVIVGRQDFTEFDLELLTEMAEEAAPGLAVAQLVERIRCL